MSSKSSLVMSVPRSHISGLLQLPHPFFSHYSLSWLFSEYQFPLQPYFYFFFITQFCFVFLMEFLCPSSSARQKDIQDIPPRPTFSKWWEMGSQKTDFTFNNFILVTKGTLRVTSTCYTVSTLHCMFHSHVFFPIQLRKKKIALKQRAQRAHIKCNGNVLLSQNQSYVLSINCWLWNINILIN